MSPLANRRFAKMNGAGNEIMVVDLRGANMAVQPAEARAIAGARGLHYDQLMVLLDPHAPDTDVFMRIYNNDGSESAACGNGTRCVAYMLLRGGDRSHLRLETGAGVLDCTRVGADQFTVDMGSPRFDWRDIPLRDPVVDTRSVPLPDPPAGASELRTFAAVSMGNPHAIFWVGDDGFPSLANIGSKLETHPIFPERANVSFAKVEGRDHIRLKVWERGAGLTLACGSAACAAAVAAMRCGFTDRKVRVSLPGGDLHIEWRVSDDHVLMTGPVELEFEGRFDPAIFGPPGT